VSGFTKTPANGCVFVVWVCLRINFLSSSTHTHTHTHTLVFPVSFEEETPKPFFSPPFLSLADVTAAQPIRYCCRGRTENKSVCAVGVCVCVCERERNTETQHIQHKFTLYH